MIKQPLSPLEQVKADRVLVEDLYAHGKIDRQTKRLALDLLYPPNQWGPWISKILLFLGTALVLVGLIFFFAFNWTKIEPWMKLVSIQVGLVACLIGAFVYGLDRLAGKLFLLSATVLTGVFMAVFGQIYQTGADAFQLFMMWSLLTLGWTLISRFSVQWFCWHVITMTFLVLWWDQAALPSGENKSYIFGILMVFNGLALLLAEVLHGFKNQNWIQIRLLRIAFLALLLFVCVIPILGLITELELAKLPQFLMGLLGFLILASLWFVYWKKIPNAWGISLTVLASAIIVETFVVNQIIEIFSSSTVILFALAGLATLGIFGVAGMILKMLLGKVGDRHA